MTGFGRAEGVFGERKLSVEVRSLNSKTLDLSLRLPARYREKEFEIRKILNDTVIRGKVDFAVGTENLSAAGETTVNAGVVKAYMAQLAQISPEAPQFELLKMAVRMPEAVESRCETVDDGEWQDVLSLIHGALEKFSEFRKTEGEILKNELSENIMSIGTYLSAVDQYETQRLEAVKEKFTKTLSEFGTLDETRFYQEMAYYTEKLDIREEKVRLSQHLKYYLEVMTNEKVNGKKLGFIAQEIGREINTLGAKANHTEIQKLVVMMKDELEKIKEQTLNVL